MNQESTYIDTHYVTRPLKEPTGRHCW